eukprot:1807858-Rhodomonas_salina.2
MLTTSTGLAIAPSACSHRHVLPSAPHAWMRATSRKLHRPSSPAPRAPRVLSLEEPLMPAPSAARSSRLSGRCSDSAWYLRSPFHAASAPARDDTVAVSAEASRERRDSDSEGGWDGRTDRVSEDERRCMGAEEAWVEFAQGKGLDEEEGFVAVGVPHKADCVPDPRSVRFQTYSQRQKSANRMQHKTRKKAMKTGCEQHRSKSGLTL